MKLWSFWNVIKAVSDLYQKWFLPFKIGFEFRPSCVWRSTAPSKEKRKSEKTTGKVEKAGLRCRHCFFLICFQNTREIIGMLRQNAARQKRLRLVLKDQIRSPSRSATHSSYWRMKVTDKQRACSPSTSCSRFRSFVLNSKNLQPMNSSSWDPRKMVPAVFWLRKVRTFRPMSW